MNISNCYHLKKLFQMCWAFQDTIVLAFDLELCFIVRVLSPWILKVCFDPCDPVSSTVLSVCIWTHFRAMCCGDANHLLMSGTNNIPVFLSVFFFHMFYCRGNTQVPIFVIVFAPTTLSIGPFRSLKSSNCLSIFDMHAEAWQ